ncbi:MAG: hypothetical protein K2P70_13560 [Hyphomonadaceae bacterium]|nr:hypothetical protein [Hyphomonadaceae bacterium]
MRSLLLSVLMLGACAQPADAPVDQPAPPHAELAQRIEADLVRLDTELTADGVVAAGLNETADLGNGLFVRPLEVVEDSRCPANVDCVWAGRVVLRADVSGQTLDLILDEPVTTPQGVVVLAVVKPYPFHDWPETEVAIPPYRFGFRRG